MKDHLKRLFPIGILFVILAMGPIVAYSQSRISGQVTGEGRRPISNTYVELLNDMESVIQRARTTGSGSYVFTVNTSGRYYVRVRPFGTDYEEQTQEVQVVNIIGGRLVNDSVHSDFHLRVRKDSSKPQGAPGVVFIQEVPAEAQKFYERAAASLAGQRLETGLSELRSAIEIFPTYFDALYLLGTELLKQANYSEAIEVFERAVAVHKGSGASWYGLAFSNSMLERTDRAVEAARSAVGTNPDSADYQLMLGISLRKAKQYIDAEKALLKAKRSSSGRSPDVLWNLALLYAHNLKNFRSAADELESYIKLKPDHPDVPLLKKLVREYRMKS
jgi:Tfp pilus assembly protein PilF